MEECFKTLERIDGNLLVSFFLKGFNCTTETLFLQLSVLGNNLEEYKSGIELIIIE